MAHEIKNPLGSISIYVQLLRKNIASCGETLSPQNAKYLDVVDEEIDAPGNPRDWLITRVHYSGSRDGRSSVLTLVPRGTDLRMTSG